MTATNDNAERGVPTYWTVKEVAAYARRSERTIRRWIEARLVRVYRLPSGGVLLRASEIRDLVEGEGRW